MVLRVIQPYTRVRIPFIAQQLNIPEPDVEQLLISLILDGRVAGRIDQVRLPHSCSADVHAVCEPSPTAAPCAGVHLCRACSLFARLPVRDDEPKLHSLHVMHPVD